MTPKEHRQLSLELKRKTKEVSKDSQKAKQLLQKTGFYTNAGKLKDFFKTNK